MTHDPVKHAVFPVAGLGTRFLPATKAVPKEMLPIATKPLIQYAFEEAVEAGIEEFIFVSSDNKQAINNHFAHNIPLEAALEASGKDDFLKSVKDWVPNSKQLTFINQDEPLGLGHAVLCAKEAVGNNPFAVILPDEMVLAKKGLLAQMADVYADVGGSIVALGEVSPENTRHYGIMDPQEREGRVVKAKGMVEKPAPEDAPSNLSMTGRYILQPQMFDYLAKGKKSVGAEIQLTDSMAAMLKDFPFYGYVFEGQRFDCGQQLGFLEANIAYALKQDEQNVRTMLQKFF